MAKRGTAKADIGSFNSALQVYSIDNDTRFPASLAELTTTWMGAVPNDPWKEPYHYTVSDSFTDYTIISHGGGPAVPNSPKKNGWDIIYNFKAGKLIEIPE